MDRLIAELARTRGGDRQRRSGARERIALLAALRRQERRLASAQRRVDALRAAMQ